MIFLKYLKSAICYNHRTKQTFLSSIVVFLLLLTVFFIAHVKTASMPLEIIFIYIICYLGSVSIFPFQIEELEEKNDIRNGKAPTYKLLAYNLYCKLTNNLTINVKEENQKEENNNIIVYFIMLNTVSIVMFLAFIFVMLI